MAMGIVSSRDFDSELQKNNKSKSESKLPESKSGGDINAVTPKPNLDKSNVKCVSMSRGRGLGNAEVPNSLRQIIGETAKLDSRQDAVELAKEFGISSSSVSAYTHGSTSTASYDKQPNKPFIDESRIRVQRRARAKLFKALHHLTEDKISAAKAKDISGIAKDMAVIIKTMEPDHDKPQNVDNGPKFVFYAPQFRSIDSFERVVAKE